MIAAGTRLDLSRTRSAAAAASSATAICGRLEGPAAGVARGRASRRAGARPAHPIATSAWPSRQARPKLSAITTPTRRPLGRAISARIRRAEASGSSGSSATVPGSGRFEVSTPALAQTQAVAGLDDQDAALGPQDPAALGRGSARPAPGPCRAPRPAGGPRRPGSPRTAAAPAPRPWRRSSARRRRTSPSLELGARRRSPRRRPSRRRTPAAPRRGSTSSAQLIARARFAVRRARSPGPAGGQLGG